MTFLFSLRPDILKQLHDWHEGVSSMVNTGIAENRMTLLNDTQTT